MPKLAHNEEAFNRGFISNYKKRHFLQFSISGGKLVLKISYSSSMWQKIVFEHKKKKGEVTFLMTFLKDNFKYFEGGYIGVLIWAKGFKFWCPLLMQKLLEIWRSLVCGLGKHTATFDRYFEFCSKALNLVVIVMHISHMQD